MVLQMKAENLNKASASIEAQKTQALAAMTSKIPVGEAISFSPSPGAVVKVMK
jgi:hypothetical protein